jgi:hypothetical protein
MAVLIERSFRYAVVLRFILHKRTHFAGIEIAFMTFFSEAF